MVEMLTNGSLDVAFALEVEPPEGLERLPLSSEELALAMSPGHELAGDAALPLQALAGHRLIAFQQVHRRGLWWRRGRRLSPAARAFVEFAPARRPPNRAAAVAPRNATGRADSGL